jgi:hypothetical protein
MNDFVENIKELLEFYEAEISRLKMLMVNNRLRESDKELIVKYSIPVFYSIWEGFFVKSLIEYINFINSQSFSIDKIKDELLTHCLDKEIDFGVSYNDFNKKKIFFEKTRLFFSRPVFYLNAKIDTKSNLNYKTTNSFLNRLCLNNLPEERNKGLNKLLLYRNNIAHGECSIPINIDIILETSEIVINCMYDLFVVIEDGINNEKFKKM